MKKTLTTILGLLLLISGQAQLPKLKLSENKRFLMTADGKPFFWLGDTGWLLFAKLTREEAETYLNDRKAKGFNVIQVMVVHSLGVKNAYGDPALINEDVSKPAVTPGNSYEDKNAYDFWDHVDYIVKLAEKKGIYMAMVPVWGSNVKAGNVSRVQAAVYARFLANRYKNQSNIIWLNGGDIKGADSLATWKIIGNTLRKNDPNHLISFHPFGRTSSSQWFHNEPWLDFNMFQSGHRSYEQDSSAGENKFGPSNYKFLLRDYALRPVKPSIDGEPSYEEIPYGLHDTAAPRWEAKDVRRYGYWEVFAGGAGYTYGHNAVMQFHKPTDKGAAYGSRVYWQDAINFPGAGQMQYLRQLMLSKPYFTRVPDQSLIHGEQGDRFNYIAATRGRDYAFIYDYTGRPFELNMGRISGKKVKASWYDPRTGKKEILGNFANTGTQRFDPPGDTAEGNDWVLILESILS